MKLYKRFLAFAMVAVMLICTVSCKDPETVKEKSPEDYKTVPVSRTAPVIEKTELAEATAESFKVSRVFSKNMILQRDEYIRIWGTAEESQNGKTVCAEFKGLKGSAEIKDGKWLIVLDGTLSADPTPAELKVYGAGDAVEVFEDVLVGDVYLVVGQSNIATTVQEILSTTVGIDVYKDYFKQEDITNDDNIRILRNSLADFIKATDKTTTVAEDLRHKRGWQKPRSAAIGTTAVGYFFAKQIVERTNNEIPIGIIECSAAGHPLASFTPAELCEKQKIDFFDSATNGYITQADSIKESRYVFNYGLNPLLNFTFSGIIWYQGESDGLPANVTASFPTRFTELMQYLRDRINQNYHDFPVIMMEYPSAYSQHPDYNGTQPWQFMDFGDIRSRLGMIPSMLENTYLVPTSDLWKDETFWNNVHPYCKYPMATRVADIAMSLHYTEYSSSNINNVAGAVVSDIKKISSTEAKLYFTCFGSGLKTSDGQVPRGFEVLTDSGWTVPKTVVLSENTITVSGENEFTAVRYNANVSNFFGEEINVCTNEGLPLVAFYFEIA